MNDLKDFIIENGVLRGYTGKDTHIKVPDTVKIIERIALNDSCDIIKSVDVPPSVIEIGDYAFDKCSELQTVSLPDTLSHIGKGAFHLCKSLTKIIIPPLVKSIEKNTFQACFSLTDVVIPDGVRSIGDWAFYWCQSLKNINIPDSVVEIGDQVFTGCDVLSDEMGFLIIRDELYRYMGSNPHVVVPDSVRVIKAQAFWGIPTICSIRFSDTVTTIEQGAISNCGNLTEVTLSRHITHIGEYQFWNCKSLKRIVFSNKILSFDGILEQLWNSVNDSDVRIVMMASFLKYAPDSVINDSAIYYKLKWGKKNIVDYAIGNDDEEVLSRLFSMFSKIPLEELDGYMDDCHSSPQCRSVIMDYKNRWYTSDYIERAADRKRDMALGIRPLDVAGWKKIYRYVKTDKGITITGYRGDDIDVEIPSVIGKTKVTAIGYKAFSNLSHICSPDEKNVRRMLRSVIIPDSVTEISRSAFCDCPCLESVTIPDTVKRIGAEAFNYCRSLTNVTIPDGVTRIEKAAFNHCVNITELTIPNSVTYIGDRAFAYCSSLYIPEIPDSVTEIGNNAFIGCHRLADAKGFLTVRDMVYEYFGNDERIVISDQVTRIGDHAFYGNDSITEVIIPEGVTGIGMYAFEFCNNLKKITVPPSVTSIGRAAFAFAPKLTLYVKAGSYAEKYAEENKVPYTVQ
ncbi:MAG: leucine-rich repeat domain-containing protein [Clostridia bacterium]|nr:leucine-rich repeat domain-containing protein [Clostridia bacterium]